MDPPSPLDSKLGALVKHHYLSWIFVLVLVGIEIAAQLITPYKRYVSQYMFVTGELKYPLKSNTVPFEAVPVIALVIPLIFVLGLNFWKRSIRDTHHAVLGLFTAVLLTAAITDSVKDGIGRPRPDFYARCFGSVNGTALYDVTGNVICTGSTAVMREAYKSFPSGHTSWSFAGMGYLSMYLAGKLGIFDKKGHSWKLLPVILPLFLAIFVGVTRIDDYWHHWTDVFAGALLGLSAAYFCYRQHFPSLYDEFASQPYAIVVGTRIFHNTTLAGTNSGVPLQSDMSTYNDVERGS
jgi:membrane-associated phospholipid phosphatase